MVGQHEADIDTLGQEQLESRDATWSTHAPGSKRKYKDRHLGELTIAKIY